MLNNENRTVYSTPEVDGGHKAEDLFESILNKQFNVPEISSDEEAKRFSSKSVVFRRAEILEDQEGHWDFKFINPESGKSIKVDITTADDPDVIEMKERNSKRYNVKILKISGRTLRLASMGAERDLEEVYNSLIGLFAKEK